MNNKLGLFIHWGVYSVYEQHEQILAKNNIPFEEYERKAMEFNPIEFNPEEWVLAAKRAGMKYLCFTAKHHDGFCLWDTKYTDYNIMNAAYGKDILKMVADACEKHGMLLSIYYSNPDWHHPNGYNPRSTHQWRAKYPDQANDELYLEFKKNQIRELLTNYGKIYTLFWDISPQFEDKSLNEFARSLQPDILINDRGHDKGDFSTPERSVPEGGRFVTMTEACQSIGEHSWAYRADEDYFSLRYLKASIDCIMARGGSYLLNVGPLPNGKLSQKSLDVLEKVGDWYNRMDGALENHERDSHTFVTSASECILTKKNGKTYLHLCEGHDSTALHIYEGLSSEVPKAARLMNNGSALRVRKGNLPYRYNEKGICVDEFVSICDIPCDDFCGEPLVIELTW